MGLNDLAGRLGGGLSGPEAAMVAESRRLAALGRELLALAPDWRGGAADQAALAAMLDDLDRAASSLDGRLVLGLLGGTGVGKSTLISALAGREISPASPVRPTTSRPVVYRHQSFPPLAGLDAIEAVHDLESLRGVAIIDFPDFDSLETAHGQLVLDRLPELDLVVWVTDLHKYADRRLYEVMARVRRLMASGAQVALLNKADELQNRTGGARALAEVLDGLADHLARFGGWTGSRPRPVSATEALAEPGDPEAGGLGPLRALLDELADEKLRRAVAAGNLTARNRAFRARLREAAQPEKWLAQLEALERLQADYHPQGAVLADLTILAGQRTAYLAPRLDRLRKNAAGPLAFFTEAWDFVVGRFRPGPETPPPAPAPAAPALAHYLAGRNEDVTFLTGRPASSGREALAAEGGAVVRKALDEGLATDPQVGSALLWLWPPVLAVLLVWAETGGQYGGPAALTAAALRAAAPWLIFGLLGEAALSRFIWFRARRRYEAAFQHALDQARAALLDLAGRRLLEPVARAGERRRDLLNRLADLLADPAG